MSRAPKARRAIRLSLGIAALGLLVHAAPASAVNIPVNSTGDGHDINIGDGICDADPDDFVTECTLRAAITTANFDSLGEDVITFTVTGVHSITTNSHNVVEPLVIDGNGSGLDGTVIDGGGAERLFTVVAETTFRDVRLQNGFLDLGPAPVTTDGGAAIRVNPGFDLTLENVTAIGNQTVGDPGTGVESQGGAIRVADGTLDISDSTITGNVNGGTGSDSLGGGIYAGGPLILTNSTISDNSNATGSDTSGGGAFAAGALSIDASTFSGNTAGRGGGGLGTTGGIAAEIINSTFSGNASGDKGGGGLTLDAAGQAPMASNTFAENTSSGPGADLLVTGGNARVTNTIFGSPGACSAEAPGTINPPSPAHNLDSGTSCGFGIVNGNQENSDPKLAPLDDYGGPTETHALYTGSPAIDMATATCGGLLVDQRGFARPVGLVCDIGAFEGEIDPPVEPPPVDPPAALPPPSGTGTPVAKPKRKCKKGFKLKKIKKKGKKPKKKCVKKKRKKKKKR